MRLIDADIVYNAIKHLKEKYWHYKTATNSQFTNDCLRYIEKQLNNAPTIDAAPVVHGHWIEKIDAEAKDSTRRRFYCSVCGKWQTYGRTNYCHHCGAKMDEVTT